VITVVSGRRGWGVGVTGVVARGGPGDGGRAAQ
jgi:hypothetical protein